MRLNALKKLVKSKEFALAALATLGDELTTYTGLKLDNLFSIYETSPVKFRTPVDSSGILEYDIAAAGLGNLGMAAILLPFVSDKMGKHIKESERAQRLLSSKYIKPISERFKNYDTLAIYIYATSKFARTALNIYALLTNIR